MTIKQILITSLLLSLLVVSSAFIPDTAKAQTEQEPADNFQLQAYLTEEQALALVFPECDEIVTDEFVMTPEEKTALKNCSAEGCTRMGLGRTSERGMALFRDMQLLRKRSGNSIRLPLLLAWARMGKSLISLSWFTVRAAAERLPKAFSLSISWGNPFKNPVRINKDIINITGATMSVQCTCAGVRKVLAVINEYYLSGKRGVSGLKVANNHLGYQVKKERKQTSLKTQRIKKRLRLFPLRKGGQGGKESISDIKLIKQTRMIMGTFAEVSIYSNDEKTAGNAIEEALNEMERMDRIMSNYKNDSELSKVNKKAAKSPVPCNAELLDVIEQSQYYSELSGGAFDITVSPIVALWGFFREKGHVPPDKEIEKLLPAVSYKNIVVKKNAEPKKPGTVFFKDIKTQIDLGAIGKGYAVDKALEIIRKCGIHNACINLGGNIYVLGTPLVKMRGRLAYSTHGT